MAEFWEMILNIMCFVVWYKLYSLWSCFLNGNWGLGKTIQAIAFLAVVFGKCLDPDITSSMGNRVEKKGLVLIISPSSVILNWESGFSKCSTFKVPIYGGANQDLVIDRLKADGVEIIITIFDTFRIQGSILSNIQWEILIIDEAHRLKNENAKLYTTFKKIRTLKRYGLTGTVMQNKIMKLFNLFDLVVPGGLGTREHFQEFYDEPLKHGGSTTPSGSFMGLSDVRHCGKMRTLEKLMNSWISMDDKILLFSYSVRMLEIFEKLIMRKGEIRWLDFN
ncbi:switch 2 [Perilla frutescens var. hirtella]|nr:switch 2 [Perilla frutescens var. hirtella]KAH6785364.1 hypothetical protein C2S51_037819 [Perilla frutescens var. frutescens]